MIKRIWTDPVWSKIIASTILAGAALIYAKIDSINKGVDYYSNIETILNKEIKLKIILLCFGALLLIFLILRRVQKKDASPFYTRDQKKLIKFNSLKDEKDDILYKWQVSFDHNNNPYITNLTAYCTKHGEVPMRFVNNCCPIYPCPNSFNGIDHFSIVNKIESIVINEWDKINLH